MQNVYHFFMCFYAIIFKILALFHPKAKLRIKGISEQRALLKNFPDDDKKCCWFHCASLGEFEQGRPLLERIKMDMPHVRIVLSFYSPSGYEKQKNYQYADFVFYMPADTKKQARNFVNQIKPDIAFFVKYEFWYFHLQALHQIKAKTYLIAGIFRKNQIFFKPYGTLFRKMLNYFSFFYLQNQKSEKLLRSIGFSNVKTVGDPRFDRVTEIARQNKPIAGIEEFKSRKPLIIAGSTWKPDEELLAKYAEKNQHVKIIFAPHEIGDTNILRLENRLTGKHLRYSNIQNAKPAEFDYLIIDNIGMLAHLYKYADICYIGGGFGAGIHNTIEAAVYGKPIVFGPKYKKFSEAKDLIKEAAAYSVKNAADLEQVFTYLLNNQLKMRKSANKAEAYCKAMTGSTELIYYEVVGSGVLD